MKKPVVGEREESQCEEGVGWVGKRGVYDILPPLDIRQRSRLTAPTRI